ncbi:MAG: putative baseplate assembly protein, partial [Gammaproteobacteria bacterium]|nr:putative baseplate assembly protein [Gammaproteobacteria bacterium]
MSVTDDQSSLSDCNCCALPETAFAAHFNRPGLSNIEYRLATHSGFLERMVTRLTRDQLPEQDDIASRRPLSQLTTRDLTDPTIALLDAWAMVADVITFYQERIANEAYMRTATERLSVLQLARSIGYELKPGVAASTVLAFTADGSKDSPPQVSVPKGTRVLSIPAKDQLPQTFETVETIVARPEWNELKPYTPQITSIDRIARGVSELRLAGTTTGLRTGDAILIVGDERAKKSGDEHWDFRVLESVEQVPNAG